MEVGRNKVSGTDGVKDLPLHQGQHKDDKSLACP